MAKRPRRLPAEFQQLLAIIEKGQLFALQDWIKAGKSLRAPDQKPAPPQILEKAVYSGFHSMVDILLRAGGWSPRELAEALDLARHRKRFDIAELLLSYGAQAEQLDFLTCCKNLDLGMMERHLRSGTDPNLDNAFAQALSTVKARPLLGFYRQFRAEFPALDDQAALALSDAVQQNQVRWTALLAWAGADPFRPVPSDLFSAFPVDLDDFTTAAKEAMWRSNPEIVKVLKLNPNPEQAASLLEEAAHRRNFTLFRSILPKVTPAAVNDSTLGGSRALNALLQQPPVIHRSDTFHNEAPSPQDTNALHCLEMLLDLGARWRPNPDSTRACRLALAKHDSRYIVQVIRLLLYTPGAVNVPEFLEFCRAPALSSQTASADPYLHEEIKELRKSTRNVSASDAVAKTETAPAVVEPPHTSPPVLPAAAQAQPLPIPPVP